MKAVLTRVKNASVEIEGKIHGQIETGFLVLLGVHVDDTMAQAEKIADKICGLRIFEDENGKMNLNPQAANAANLLIISQFTLFPDRRSRRPGFPWAPRPQTAIHLFQALVRLGREPASHVETGVFGADMQVRSKTDGPVPILHDATELWPS